MIEVHSGYTTEKVDEYMSLHRRDYSDILVRQYEGLFEVLRVDGEGVVRRDVPSVTVNAVGKSPVISVSSSRLKSAEDVEHLLEQLEVASYFAWAVMGQW